MDARSLDLLSHAQAPEIRRLLAKLPRAAVADRVDRALWGVVQRGNPAEAQDAVRFAQALCDGRNFSSAADAVRRLLDRDWSQEMDKVMGNPGEAFEWFLVDWLKRHGHGMEGEKYLRPLRLRHEKTSPEHDSEGKVDFISQAKIRTRGKTSKFNFGIQLTTTKSAANVRYFREDGTRDDAYLERGGLRSKAQVVQARSLGLPAEGAYVDHPESYRPDAHAILTVNSSINRSINLEQTGVDNVFRAAFRAWAKAKFPAGGPGKFLPEPVAQDLARVGRAYSFGLAAFVKLLVRWGDGLTKTLESYDYDRNDGRLQLVTNYDPVNDEFVRMVFKGKTEMLLKLSVFMNDRLAAIVGKNR